MPVLDYDVLNVFALPDDPFSGNPLAVVRGADGLDTATCQAIARQFNLSETTFVYAAPPPAPGAAGAAHPDATVRVFTPSIELPFAGHPTLGTAWVVGTAYGTDRVVLRMPAGDIAVVGAGDRWTLTARPARLEESHATAAQLAQAIGARADAVVGPAVWVDAGLRQLLLEVGSADVVRGACPDVPAVLRHAMTDSGEALLYVWAWSGPDTVEARLFFSQTTAVVEDPATGSAAANLGGLMAHRGERGRRWTIHQGAAVGRPSRLHVDLDEQGGVHVGGVVRQLGSGTLRW